VFQADRATGHCGGLPARLHRAGRRTVSAAALKFRDFAPGRTGADPALRGAGPEAGDGSAAQTCSSVHPAETEAGFGGVLCFPKTEYWDQLPGLSSESNAKTPRHAFCAGAFRMGFPRGILCSAYTERYPIPASGLAALRLPTPSDRNVNNALENIVRMEPGKSATHYISGSVYAEYEEVISRPRFRRSEAVIAGALHTIREKGLWVRPTEAIRACSDPDDDIFWNVPARPKQTI
jgi:hypothetical protein